MKPTYAARMTQAGRVAVMRLNPAWVVACRFSGDRLEDIPRIDPRCWAVDAIVWERKCATGKQRDWANSEATHARAVVLAAKLTRGELTEDDIPNLPRLLPYDWAVKVRVQSWRNTLRWETNDVVEVSQPTNP